MRKALREVRLRHRILVAEDDPATLALLKRQLERAGYEVMGCSDGKQALDVLTDWGPDIVVADWAMPGLSGVELCRSVSELRAVDAVRSLHFILLTAHSEVGRVVEGLEAGADDFLRKPYNFQELLARIRAGERLLRLQEELTLRQLDLSKSNAQLAMLNAKLTRLANFDSLTELPNRRYILERLGAAWEFARRRSRPLSCAMLDIDHFKRINDTHGHKAGDLVLQAVAAQARQVSRRYDLCGRVGGEEFLLFCPDESATGAASLAERLRIAIAREPASLMGTAVHVTASLGVAELRADHGTVDALLAEADAMLYAAKQHGRNQVWCGGPGDSGYRWPRDPALASAAVGLPPAT